MYCIQRVLVVVALIVRVSLLVSGDDTSSSQCSKTPESAFLSVKKEQFCNYDRDDIPVNETTDTVEVRYILYPYFFVLNEYTNTLLVPGRAQMFWTDLRLGWNKTKHDGLNDFVIPCKDIWMPNIDVDTYDDKDNPSSYLRRIRQCPVVHFGEVGASFELRFSVYCSLDVQRWPFDSDTCNISLASRMDSVRFNVTYNGLEYLKYDLDRDWRLVRIERWDIAPDEDSPIKREKIVFGVTFERHSGILAAIFVIPSIVMLVATLSTFCLDPEGAARMSLIGANTISHCLFLMYLAWYLPANGDKTPFIVTFFRDSFVLVGVSLVITVCAGKMRAAARAPPAWVTSIADGVQDSPAQHLLFNGLYTKSDAVEEEEDTVAAVMTSSTRNKWRRIATLLDRISLLVFATIITGLSCSFLP